MKILGLMPYNSNYTLFYFIFGYQFYQMIMGYVDLFLFSNDLVHALTNLTQTLSCTNQTIKLITLRLWIKYIKEIMEDYKRNLNAKDFTDEEVEILVLWNAKSKIYMKLLLSNIVITTITFNFMPLLSQIGASKY